MVSLYAFIEEHVETVEADLQQFYNVRLSDLGGALSWRRCGVLLRQLPLTSRTHRAVGGDVLAWGTSEHLLATIVDLLAGANWQRSGGKGERPRAIPRPGMNDKKDARRMGSAMPIDDARVVLDAWARGEAVTNGS